MAREREPQQDYRIRTRTWPEGILVTDAHGTLTYVNPALEEMFGIPSSTSIGTHFRNYVTPASAENAEALFCNCARGKIIRDIELEAVHQDQHVFPIEIIAIPILRDGKFQGVKSIVRDITRRKCAEEALQASEQRYRELFEANLAGVCLTRPDGTIVDFNRAIMRMLGYDTREELLQHQASDLCEDPEFRQEMIHLLQRDGVVPSRETVFKRKDGVAVYALVSAMLLTNGRTGETLIQEMAVDITDRKRIEEALRESEQRFRAILENSLDVVYRRDLRHNRYDYISPVVEQILGFRPQEFGAFTNDDLFARIHPDDAERIRQEFDRAIKNGMGTVEYRFQAKDGTYRWLADYFMVQKDDAGQPLYLTGTARNITGLKQTEKALRNSEQRFRKLFEADLMGVFITKLDGTFLDCNDAMVKMLGYESREELMRHRSSELYVDPEFRREAIQVLQKDGIYLGKEGRVWRKDGSIAHLLGAAVLLRDEETGEPYVQGVAIDITERKHTEEALQASEQRYRRLFEANLAGVYLTKPDGTILDFNNAMMRMLGYDSREEVFAHRSSDFYADPALRRELVFLLHRDGIVPAREAALIRKDGSILHALGHAVLLVNEQTGEPYIQGVAIDITERKQAEELLRELTRTLESKVVRRTAELQRRTQQLQKVMIELSEAEDRERKRLAEVLHDDLQQELAAAKFHVGMIRRQVRHDPSLQATAAQADHLLRDAIAKSRSLSHELCPAMMHHGDFVQTLQWLAGEMHTKHGLLVHVQADSQVRAESETIRTLLYRAVQELLFNAVKHAQVKEARIRVRQYDRCIFLCVSDRGRGFDPQELGETTGFGLLSIRDRVELLKGCMRIRSAKGRGSRFSIIVPVSEQVSTPPSCPTEIPPPEAAGPPAEQRLRVLLADDHEIVRQGLVSLLSEEHMVEVVGEAANGREAVDLAERLHPDVVIMDVSMPLIDGDVATREIKAHQPETRVIALSMYEEPEKRDAMQQAGAENYVLKTAPAEELLAAIRGQDADSWK